MSAKSKDNYDYSDEFCDIIYHVANRCYKYFKRSLGSSYKPQHWKLPFFEFLAYLSVRLDLAIFKKKLPDHVVQSIFNKIWKRMDEEFRNLHGGNISDCFNGRMSQYAKIFRTYRNNELWKELHNYLAELLKHAAVEKKLFLGQWTKFPLILMGLTKDIAIKMVLIDIEKLYINPFDKACNEMVEKLKDIFSD